MKTNEQLQSDIRSELAWDPRVDDANIDAVVTGGVATLNGTVPTFADRLAAERAAERVFGVRAVANELAVAVPIHFERSDTDIAHAVVNALSWDVEVPDARIKSSVSNGVVRLDGDVDYYYQRAAATRAVRNLSGVREVINTLAVTPKGVSTYDVTQSIKQALERRADRTAERINVQTVGGIVTLTGRVPSIGDRRAAEGAAWSAQGVTDVHDELAVL